MARKRRAGLRGEFPPCATIAPERSGCLWRWFFWALFGWCRSEVTAGPGNYDPATRTFNLTYTFAVVPSAGMMGAQLEQLGQVQPATPDQNAQIRAYFAAVSDKLWQATGQKGKIGTLNLVDNVKQADVIVSPTGKIGRGGYATPGGFEDRQGHLVISYEDLTASGKDIDAQLTIFHELCHYLFALPDEYRDNEQVGLCPAQNGSGPGCLMDNYWFDGPRHGWYGRFCNGDHNAQAPTAPDHHHGPDRAADVPAIDGPVLPESSQGGGCHQPAARW